MSNKIEEKEYKRFIEDVVECIKEWKTTKDLSLEEACENNGLHMYLKVSYKYRDTINYYEVKPYCVRPWPEETDSADIIIKSTDLDLSFFGGHAPFYISLEKALNTYTNEQ